MPGLNYDAVPQHQAEIVTREIDDEIYICSADGETMFTITTVGADIWRACDGSHSVSEIVEILIAAYEVDRETVERDLEAYLTDLETKQLIVFI
ncbi:MAG: PqqD family protein [bacterium]